MSFCRGILQIHSIVQKIISRRNKVNRSGRLEEDPGYNNPLQRIFRCYSYIALCFEIVVNALQLCWFFIKWDSYTVYHIHEPILCTLTVCYSIITVTVVYAEREHHVNTKFIVNQLVTVESDRQTSFGRILEGSAYGLSVALLSAGPSLALIPFVINFGAIQVVFGASIWAKILGSLHYFLYGIHAGYEILLMIGFATAFAEGLCNFSNKFLPEIVDNSNRLFTPKVFMKEFYKCQKKFVEARILLTVANDVISLTGINVTYFGIYIASCTAYATLALYSQFPLMFYFIMPNITILCFVVAIFLTISAGKPQENGLLFVQFWMKYCSTDPIAKRMIIASPVIGFEA